MRRIALDTQINLYSVDTGFFYSHREAYLHNMNCKYRQERNYICNKLPEYEELLCEYGYTKRDLSNLKNGHIEDMNIIYGTNDLLYEYMHWQHLIKHKREKAKRSKAKLLQLLQNKADINTAIKEMSDKQPLNRRGSQRKLHHNRYLASDMLGDNCVISLFESALTRLIGIERDELTDALVVVQIFYLDMFRDLLYNGFYYNGEKYIYYTSSAGQIRKKKAVFIKETIWQQHEKTIMCGLTIDSINASGGNNVNKHLAYLALTNSATDEWVNFDIDKCIVIDDFETDVQGTYDFIDETDYSITRETGVIPIPHTDGAGMILPYAFGESQKNTMVRLSWIKGLLGVFDYRKFIEEHHCPTVIKDIYGCEHDIVKEDIQVIFTKSQFKMHSHYASWQEYKDNYKKYHCTAGRCNIEEDRIKSSKINYQMLQSLTDINDDEIHQLAQRSIDKINNLCGSQKSMMEALGITPYNTNMTYFQQAVKIYPALLNDTFAKDTLRDIKNSLVKKYRSGKLEINGKFTFVLPDFYAACEYWFMHTEQPKGLLADREVFCELFNLYDKLDCLRSPHLYKEHAVRYNTAHQSYDDRAENIRKWFQTNAIYTSCHDLISKILQLDVDGDKLLVVADPLFISIAERNMNNIVPLYYNMKKAESVELNSENMYNGLHAAFVGGNIGLYSNNITKIWNDEVFINGTDADKQIATDCVKRLCCQGNFVIDYAKSLYKPEFPDEIKKQVSVFTNKKLPAFFEFAKDKKKSQVAKRNKSFVNKLYKLIPNRGINTRLLKLDELDYHKLMNDVNTVCLPEVSDLYNELNKQYRYKFNLQNDYLMHARYLSCKIRDQFAKLGYTGSHITDMLVKYAYGNNIRYKELLWFCFGSYIVDNLRRNVIIKQTKYIQCLDCGEWIEVDIDNRRTYRCPSCQDKFTRTTKTRRQRKYRQK